MSRNYQAVGKQVIYDFGDKPAEHIADAADSEKAHCITVALNERSINFIDDALRTCSPNWYGDKVSRARFITLLNDAIRVANQLDKYKKTLFYGRDNNLEPSEGSASLIDLPNRLNEETPDFAIDIIHGIIGKFTEAGELLEALKKWINNHEEGLDTVNINEEIGDGFWYDAIILNRTDSTFEETQNKVIAKLRSRFPDKFTDQLANERNLAAERAILEDKKGGFQTIAERENFEADWPDAPLPSAFDPYADGDIEPPSDLASFTAALNLKPSEPASGPAAVERAAEEAKRAFDNVGKVIPQEKPEIEPDPNLRLDKSIAERLQPMPQEKLAQENNPKPFRRSNAGRYKPTGFA